MIPERDEYPRRFGYEVSSSVIHDPVRTAFVQFLRLRGDSSYLGLVDADRPEGKLGNALASVDPGAHLARPGS